MAIAPVVAGQRLLPGDHVGLENGVAIAGTDKPLGIVDPFLKRGVEAGQRFYIFLYPKTVTGMRHHWSHPAFTGEDHAATPEQLKIQKAKVWVTEIANRCGVSYERMIDAIARDTYVNMGQNEDYKDVLVGTIPELLREHCSTILGREIEGHVSPFSCSC